jgi:hypothetical protein
MLASSAMKEVLWTVSRGAGRTPEYWLAIGTPLIGGVPLRVDRFEEVSARLRESARKGPFVPPPELLTPEEQTPVLTGLGYVPDGEKWRRRR